MDRFRAHMRMTLAVLAVVALAAAAATGCGGSSGPTDSDGLPGAGAASGGVSATSDAGGAQSPSGGSSGDEGGSPGATGTSRPSPGPSSSAPALRVVFVDVGQGDAAVLRSGAWTGLIDGGPAGSEAAVGAALAKLGVRRLDVLLISHLHADHTGGLAPLVRRYRPRRAWVAGSVKGGLAAALRDAGTLLVQARRGLSARFGRAKATVLAPGGLSGDANTDSVVLLLQAGGRRLVFTGDSTGSGEAAAGASLARGPPVDVLKVSHHGSRYSTTTGFVAAARPRVAVISVGGNSYGHPSNDAVQRLRAGGTRVFSTQKNGSLTLTVTSRGALRWSFSRSAAALVRGISRSSGSVDSSSSGGSSAAASGASSSGTSAAGGARVFVTATGDCYHREGCRYLSSSRIAVTLARAKADGYRACSVCDPPH